MVPFRPTGNRPIFCNDCFRTEGGSNMNRSEERYERPPSDRQLYDAVCSKCGNRCQIPFQPRPGRQVLCSHCFEQKERGENTQQEKLHTKDDFIALHAKLDKILELLATPKVIEPTMSLVVQEESKEEPVKKPIKKLVKKATTEKKSTKAAK